MSKLNNKEALDLLNRDAQQIENLILNQKNFLCVAHCKAFEEVVDTQMYGFSKEVDFAIRIGILTKDEGHAMVSELEQRLNNLYTRVYEKEELKEELKEEKNSGETD